MYRYETHMHTYPVSKCAKAGVEESVKAYADLGYDGIFITNHFLDGNTNADPALPYAQRIEFYCGDYQNAKEIGAKLGIKVFFGVELSYGGTDFLVYGLDKQWYLAHPEIMEMPKSQELPFMMSHGAYIVHAHPYREANYIDHIRLFPRCVQGVEVINANRTELENAMAKHYAQSYGLMQTAGSDNHTALRQANLAGMQSKRPIESEQDFIQMLKCGALEIFSLKNPLA